MANGLPLHLCPTTKMAEDMLASNLVRTAKDMHSRLAWTHEWEEGDEIIINRTNFAQEWAIEANQNKHLEAIPGEYQRHAKVLRPSTRRSRCQISVSRAFEEDKDTQRSSLLSCHTRAEPRRQAWL